MGEKKDGYKILKEGW